MRGATSLIGAIAIAVAAACGGGGAGSEDAAGAADARDDVDGTAGPADADLSAPTDVPAVPCDDSIDAVYAAAPSAFATAGTILACAPDPVFTQGEAQERISEDIVATSAVAMFRIAYATRDSTGAPAVSTARAYLPSTPRARPVPLAVAAHGTEGLADACVSSAEPGDALPLPYAARGYATIAPDLAGLGNAGTQEYLDNRAQGMQVLDAARALRALLPAGLTAPELVLAGYSQGGGAVLSAQALIRTDAPTAAPPAGTLVGTVAYAPQWPIRLESFDYLAILRDPDRLTILTGLSYSSVAVLRQFAWFENHVGPGHGADSVPAEHRDGLTGAVDTQCLVALGGWIQTNLLHTGDLIDPALRLGLLACIDGEPGCDGVAHAYHASLVANHLAPDPAAGPVRIIQGLGDQIMPAAKEASCIADRLAAAGVAADACAFAFATHGSITDENAVGVAWSEAMTDGGAAAACPEATALPACQ